MNLWYKTNNYCGIKLLWVSELIKVWFKLTFYPNGATKYDTHLRLIHSWTQSKPNYFHSRCWVLKLCVSLWRKKWTLCCNSTGCTSTTDTWLYCVTSWQPRAISWPLPVTESTGRTLVLWWGTSLTIDSQNNAICKN